ncbi:MAG: patatin-like phospholipase family protein [Idiomarina sp.]|nr:patatin-like phospholipase family protein [Idiomarina sp.]
MINSLRVFFFLLLTGALTTHAYAKTVEPLDRPKVGLVLGGGGAKGLAHIGVLQRLEELQIPINLVVGTSMGAIAGGLYAQGNSPDELAELVLTVDWQNLFTDEPPRSFRGFRRKEEDRVFPVQFSVGFNRGEFNFPSGIIQGQRLMPVLRERSLNRPDLMSFDDYALPFRATAVDIETGELVILDEGDIALAMRASMAIPGIFSPVKLNDRYLVDGGMVNNLPIDLAIQMGADIVIVVDVGDDFPGIDELNGPLALMEQAINLMIRRSSRQQVALLREQDIHLVPDLLAAEVTAADFGKARAAIDAGYQAADSASAAILRTVTPLDDIEWQTHIARVRHQRRAYTPMWYRIYNESKIPDEMLWANMSSGPGEQFSATALNTDIERIYGLGYFEQVDYQVVWSDDEAGVEIRALPRSWGPNYLSFGLTLEENFDTQSNYRAAVSYLRTEVNNYGAEFQTDLQIGNEPFVRAQYWQPLRRDARAYTNVRALVGSSNVNLFDDGRQVSRYRINQQQIGFDLGFQWQHRADLRLRFDFGVGQATARIRNPEFPDRFDFTQAKVGLQATYDTIDSVYLPKDGVLFSGQYETSERGVGADVAFHRIHLHYLGAQTTGNHTWVRGFRVQSTLSGESPVYDAPALGGFMNLSGYERNELTGQHLLFGQLAYLRRLSASRQFGSMPVYLGGSFEVGQVWDSSSSVQADDLIYSGSLLSVITTPFGALYIGLSHSSENRTGGYLAVGRPF